MRTTFLRCALACAVAVSAAGVVRAAVIASDNASDAAYASGWANGSNGGSGFGPWVLTSGGGGTFIGDSSGNGTSPSGNINTTGAKSWGLYGGGASGETAARTLTGGNLAVGQSINVSFDNGFVDSGPLAGFQIGNAAAPGRFQFDFLGGSNNYEVRGNTTQNTTHGFTADGMSATFTLTAADTFSLKVNYNTGSPVSETFTGTLGGTASSGVDRITVFNSHTHGGGQYDAFVNSIAVTPEPSAAAGLLIVASGAALSRRRTGRRPA